MHENYETFSNWWHAPEQEELRKSCATGWGWEIWQAGAGQQLAPENIPEIIPGWKLVPVEPNWEMLSANGCKEHHRGQACLHHDNRRRIWAAMLAAAPEVTSGTTD